MNITHATTKTGKPAVIITMTEEEYQRENDDYMGYCLECGAVSEDNCEPDAERYKCSACGALAVAGVEQMLLLGRLRIEAAS